MESILYLAEVIAFLVVIGWACLVEHTGDTARGVLGMQEEGVPAGPSPAAQANWKRVPTRAPAQPKAAPEKPLPMRNVGPTPAWRRTMRSDRRRR